MLDLKYIVCGNSKNGSFKCKNKKKVGIFGEDAFLNYSPKNKNIKYFSVADGVGSWVEIGINPVEFTCDLMNGVVKVIDNLKEDEEKSCYDMIQESYAILKEEHDNKKNHYGSCTFNLAKINLNNGKMEVANIGDSALCVFRNGKITFSTKICQQDFNFPYQIGFAANGKCRDCKDDTQSYQYKLKKGDLILSATDGIWDGMNFEQVERAMANKFDNDLKRFAKYIRKKAMAGTWKDIKDDITIILAQVI